MAEADEQLKETIESGINMLRDGGAAAGITHVLHQASALGGEDIAEFSSEAYYGIANEGLWDEIVDLAESLRMLDRLPDTAMWGNAVAETGKYLSRDERFEDRGQAVLRKAAVIFEGAYVSMGDAPLEERRTVLLEDYFRVATLQDEVEDREGARQTAETIAPHLVSLAQELDASGDDIDRISLEGSMRLAITYLGGLSSPEAKELFKHISHQGEKDRITQTVLENLATDLLMVGRVEDCLAVFVAANLEGPLNCWERAKELWQAGEHNTVWDFIDGIDNVFPDYFGGGEEGDNEVVALMTPAVEVLTMAYRDDLIKTVFSTLVTNGSDILPITQFAYHCGYADQGRRLERVVDGLATDSDVKLKIYEAYQTGRDHQEAEDIEEFERFVP